HPGRICESGPVADGDMAGAVDDRHVLDVEVVGEERGPHQARLDSDAEIAATDRSLRAVQGAVEGLVAKGLLGHVGPYAHAPDAGRERQRGHHTSDGPDFDRVVRSDSDAQRGDRKSTRLNSSHVSISYAVF